MSQPIDFPPFGPSPFEPTPFEPTPNGSQPNGSQPNGSQPNGGQPIGPSGSEHLTDALHQPPDPADLRQAPPQTPQCAYVRGMLRDFVDHDLVDPLQVHVENHVHSCRTCALALARTEYEVFRLRSGFLGSWAAIGPRPGFSKRTIARLLSETATDRRLPLTPPAGARPGAGTPVGAAAGPKEGGSRFAVCEADGAVGRASVDDAEAGDAKTSDAKTSDAKTRARIAGARWAPRRRILDKRSAMFAAVFGLLCCAVTFGMVWRGTADLASVVRLSIVDARGAWRDAGFDRHRIRAGDGLGEGGILIVDPDGVAVAHWHDASQTGKQPAAAITVEGDGLLRLQDGLPLLVRGAMHVTSQREMSVLLGDGSSVRLGAGEYHVSATEQSTAFDRLAAMTPALSVRVEVLEGDAATLALEGGGGSVIGVGQYGRYGNGFAGIAVENLPSPSISAAAGISRQMPDSSPMPTPDLMGFVVDPLGVAVPDSQVVLQYQSDQYQSSDGLRATAWPLVTDGYGRFELPAHSEIREGFALITVFPPSTHLGFAVQDARRFGRGTHGGFVMPQTQLANSSRVLGEVVDSAHQGLSDVAVVPCLYDELLGLVQPWPARTVTSNAVGTFAFDGLPAVLPQHQTLCVIAFHGAHQVAFQPLPLPGSSATLLGPVRVVLEPLRTVSIQGLTQGTCEIYEELSTLPLPGIGLRRHTVFTSNGSIEGLAVGSGQLWMRAGTQGVPQLQRISASPTSPTLVTEPEPRSHDSVFRLPIAPLNGMVALASCCDQVLYLAAEARHSRFRPLAGQTSFFVVGANARGVEAVQDAQVFALSPRASGGFTPRFLGLQDASGMRVDLDESEAELVAIGPSSTTWLDRAQLFQAGHRSLRLAVDGSVEMSPSLLPQDRALQLKLAPVTRGAAGDRPPLFRLVSAADWIARDIPPGQYLLTDELGHFYTITVRSGEATRIGF